MLWGLTNKKEGCYNSITLKEKKDKKNLLTLYETKQRGLLTSFFQQLNRYNSDFFNSLVYEKSCDTSHFHTRRTG